MEAKRLAGATRLLSSCFPAAVVVLCGAAWVWDAAARASWSTLGRDQGIFQYVAWAIGKGDLAYRDIRDVNGPVVAMVHLFLQALGGADERRFRILDLSLSALAFGFVGACLPSLGRQAATFAQRAAWAIAAVVALGAQYLAYGYWDTAQRESFFDWFVVVSLGVQALRASPRRLALAGAASVIPWLGKPTYALFTVAQIVAILVEDEPFRTRLRRAAAFGGGGALGALAPLVFLLWRGDIAAWARITFVDVPAMYRFIWPRAPHVIFSMPGYNLLAAIAVTTMLGFIALVVSGRVPRRALPIAAMPVMGLVSVAIQAKGFPYHFHPVSLGVSLAWLAALVTTWQRVLEGGSVAARALVIVAAGLVGGRAAMLAAAAPFPPPPSSPGSDAHLSAFDRVDYFPRALRDAAAYVAGHSRPDERVQVYGMDAYLLFLAGRRSATPYIYAYDLDVDAALYGSFDPDGLRPTEAQAARIQAMRDEHEHDMLARLEEAPPPAFVFVGRSPLMSYQDAVVDFATHCPAAALWVSNHYRETADFEGIRVWLRNDVRE